eukprot:1454013-Prymnesium_polylepis.1
MSGGRSPPGRRVSLGQSSSSIQSTRARAESVMVASGWSEYCHHPPEAQQHQGPHAGAAAHLRGHSPRSQRRERERSIGREEHAGGGARQVPRAGGHGAHGDA